MEAYIFLLLFKHESESPVFVIAASDSQFGKLESSIIHVKKYFPTSKVIVYDLGLNLEMIKKVI